MLKAFMKMFNIKYITEAAIEKVDKKNVYLKGGKVIPYKFSMIKSTRIFLPPELQSMFHHRSNPAKSHSMFLKPVILRMKPERSLLRILNV